jgi:hypothetical protein
LAQIGKTKELTHILFKKLARHANNCLNGKASLENLKYFVTNVEARSVTEVSSNER